MALEFVHMTHPEIGATVRVSRKAYEVAWKDRGWELTEGEVTVDAPSEPEDTGAETETDTWDLDPMSNDE